MASVRVAHICEGSVKLPTEGSGIVLVFFVSWRGVFFVKLLDELLVSGDK